MNSNKVKAVVFATLLFGLGIAVGALSHRYYAATSVSAKSAEDFRFKYLTEMQTKLKLDQHQVDKLQVILDDTKAEFKALKEKHRPEMAAVKNDQVTRVKAILTAEQAQQYAALVAEREKRAKQQEAHERREDQRQREGHLKALAGK